MATVSNPAADLSCIVARYKDLYLTKASSMIGAYELGGVDPTGLGENEKKLATALLRSLIRNSPPDMTLTQYYIHQYDSEVTIRCRKDKRSNTVSKRRELFLQNKRKMCNSRIFFLPELPFSRDLSSLYNFEFFQNLVTFPVSKESRNYIKTRYSEKAAVLAYEEDVKDTYHTLNEEMQNHLARLNLTSFGNHQLDGSATWSLMKALHTFDFDYLNMKSKPSTNSLDSRIFESNCSVVDIKGVNYLKFAGIKPMYVRFASVKGFSDEYIDEALFASGLNAPLNNPGNYIFMTRYKGFNKATQNKYFKDVKDDVSRNQVDVMDMMTGNAKSQLEQQMLMSDKDKAVLDEVNHAQTLADYHGRFEAYIAVFSEEPEEITKTSKLLRASLNQSGVDLVWETGGLQSTFECFLPGSQFKPKRSMVLNSTKASALSLYYKASKGLPTWKRPTSQGEKLEESFYIFESNDGTPFYYTPYIGGKCMTIGIGPIRSGKTFMKNTLATHFMKFGGFYTAIDIDPGTEAIAKFYQDDGSIFRIDDEFNNGFNPFHIANGENDKSFRAHFIRQLEQMIKSNSNDELKVFTRGEQKQIDDAILSTLKLPENMRSFTSFLDHCNSDVRLKLSRFCGEGMYARLYDNEVDAIGTLKKRFSVYNIMGVKNDDVALPLTMNEIVYRVLRSFENPKLRDYFKMLDIDEAHEFLGIPGAPKFLTKGVRTWGKWNGCVSLWTQSPLELGRVPDWPALRSAASTFWFMADGEMDRQVYRDVFSLSEGHLDAIESLKPKQQAFIYQPEIRVAKVVNLFAEPEQAVINTSVAGEAMRLIENMKKFKNVDEAIQQTIKDLKLKV